MCSETDPSATAIVTNVQRFSLHDGGGIRTVAFLKGCPFRCPWCCNPENLSFAPEVSMNERLCIRCSPRPDGRLCERSPEECPTGAKTVLGRERTVDDLVDEVGRDRVFFEESGGGVTLSGGEALAREAFATEFLARCKAAGMGTALETTLALPLADAKALVEATDVFLVDFKIADRERSRALTGIDPDVRDANLRTILALGAKVIGRMPIIPGYTDGRENVAACAARLIELGIRRVDVLPFHQLGEGKYDALGHAYACRGMRQLSEEDVAPIVDMLERGGISTVVSGE
ncbi:MAG: glycyl-radical enzyme activating protein [Atopobiaceae bacterium]|jgi:pyruvate formate lyase activating enzyme